MIQKEVSVWLGKARKSNLLLVLSDFIGDKCFHPLCQIAYTLYYMLWPGYMRSVSSSPFYQFL